MLWIRLKDGEISCLSTFKSQNLLYDDVFKAIRFIFRVIFESFITMQEFIVIKLMIVFSSPSAFISWTKH